MALNTIPRLWPAPSVEEVQAIVRMEDPVLRNLRITQAYHDLKVALADVFGEENVSWCAFASWASKTAGTFIRKEQLGSFLQEIVDRADARSRSYDTAQALSHKWGGSPAALQLALTRTVEEVVDEIAQQLARGNLVVFAELGPLYADMRGRVGGSTPQEPGVLRGLIERLTPGAVEQGGQELLIQAITHYDEAIFESSPKRRAELLLLANLLVGYHEQVRLQDAVAGALNAPVREIFNGQIAASLGSFRGILPGAPVAKSLAASLNSFTRWLEQRWRELATHALMRMELPDVTLRLGEDLPSLASDRDFPPDLAQLEHPELVQLLARLDRTPDATRGSGARDWANLADRMNLIVDLFRSRQQDRMLFDQPFTFLQVEAMSQGRLPHGRL
ncbi:hypothetical protein JRI60_35905 [Archangium violaceum]|uniref:hypothetical protein n=1 Tax=Archangium violaceum TaxID=83451 RepID=UPI001950B6A1|nr:hypothetical protein [Archangium violaceum]QRN94481.1 hypothetical protein JRI60_35905 [Archangium violaceum]